jgi:sugar lactone lactonase YvrE
MTAPPVGTGPAGRADPWATSQPLQTTAACAGLLPPPDPYATRGSGDSLPEPPRESWPLVPGYEILGELGRGGMGVVYKARQAKLDRVVALKMILHSRHAGADGRARFRAEAEAVARLQHPNIVQIFEVGEHDGLPFFALEYLEGGTLDRKLTHKPAPVREAAALVRTLADAVQAAHARGIVHRDLKPANVLLSSPFSRDAESSQRSALPSAPRCEDSALRLNDRQPKITDFGLAKRLDRASETRDGSVMGTPHYMAPEQAAGQVEQVGPAADVYALGAILYECLTGRPPFLASSVLEVLEQVRTQEAVSPRRLRPGVPADLETICLKCLRKEPARRYTTARELADDLGRFLEGKPVLARPVGWPEKVGKWARREPLAAALLSLVALVTATGLTGVLLAWRSAVAAHLEADERAEERDLAYQAEARQRESLEQQLCFSRIALADREIRAGKSAWARRLLDLCPGSLRHWEWQYLDRRVRGAVPVVLDGPQRGVSCVAFDREGTTLAAASGDGSVRLWRSETGKPLHELTGHDDSVNWVCFAPDGKRLASADAAGVVALWDAQTGQPCKRLTGHEQPVSALAWHPDGRLLASATFPLDGPGEVWLWDVGRGRAVRRFRGHAGRVSGLAWGRDGGLLASAGHDGTVRLLDGETFEERLVLTGHRLPVSAVAFSPDGLLLASAAGRVEAERPEQGEVLLWRADTGEVVHRLTGHVRRPTTVAFSPDGQRLASAGWDGEVKLWDVATGQEVLTLTAGAEAVMHVAFSPDGRWLAAGSLDLRVRLFDGGK